MKSLCLLFLLVIVACTAREQPTPAPVSTSTVVIPTLKPTLTPLPTREPTPTFFPAINQLSDVKNALIRVEAARNFIDPAPGLGAPATPAVSGFVISPSGLAITSSQAVVGARDIQAHVGESEQAPRSARLIGFSECTGLALLDLEGDGYPYLSWSDVSLRSGQEVDVAGFIGDPPRPFLIPGSILDPQASGDTPWTAVDGLILYQAGSDMVPQGGPVVTSDGRVAGVQIGNQPDTRQAFALPSDLAQGVVAQIMEGQNLSPVGIHGWAVKNPDGSLAGIWVAAVQPGSAAEQAGIKGGDLINQIAGRPLANTGTKAEYCEILGDLNSQDVTPLQVIRWPDGEVLEGALNGDRLAVVGKLDLSKMMATATPELVVGELFNPNASQPGELYLSYTFNTRPENWETFVTSGDPNGYTAEVIGGALRFDIKTFYTYVYYIYEPLEAEDVRLDLRARNRGENNNNVSLVCRYSELGWYEFNVASNGLFWIYRFDPNQENPYLLLWDGGSFDINMGQDSNEYSATCQGGELTLYVNGEKLRTVHDDTLSSGKVGFSVSSYNRTPVVVDLDRFSARVP